MREDDIRPQDILDEYLRLSAADALTFFADPASFEHRDCPGCGANQPQGGFEKAGFRYVRCASCNTLYAAPAPTLAGLSAFYSDSPSQRYLTSTFYPRVTEARREKIFRPRVERIGSLLAEHGTPGGTVIDVGAGTGIFLSECRNLGVGGHHRAVEPSASAAGVCAGLGFDTFHGFADDAAADPAWAASADLVVSFEVIEHVHSVVDFITDMRALAKPGGLVLATGLCGTGFDIMTLGKRAKAVSPPHHLNFLSRVGVSALLARCGLEEVAFLTPGQLDVDIVRNILAQHDDAVTEPFLRALLTEANDSQRAAFQTFLAENGLSSHMWILARRPEGA